MQKRRLEQLLQKFKAGKLSLNSITKEFQHFTFSEIKDAKIDLHRELRKGFPEVIFGENKTAGQIAAIAAEMKKNHVNVMATRIPEEKFKKIKKQFKAASYNKTAKILFIESKPIKKINKIIAVITAGTSNIPVAEEAAFTAEAFGNKVERIYDVGVAGIHRLFAYKEVFIKANVFIVAAGMEGALPSVVGGLVDKVVIGVPTSVGYGASFSGVTPLLSMLTSCTSNVTVVNIDNGFGAGCVASLINHTNIE